MTLDNMTGITKASCTADDTFCKSQLITCTRVKECNGVCPFEDALKHADKMQTMDEQHTVDHDRDWIIGCIKYDGFIKTDRFDKANQIILDALSAEVVQGYTEWLEKIIVDNEGANEWLCEDTPDIEWCENNCHYSSIQAVCLRHLYEVSKGGDDK